MNFNEILKENPDIETLLSGEMISYQYSKGLLDISF